MLFFCHTLLIFSLNVSTLQTGAEEFELWKQARVHWYNKEWSQAAEAYQDLIAKYPDSPRRCKSENYLGYCFDRMGKKKEALAIFEGIIQQGSCKAENILDAKGERLKLAHELIETEPNRMMQILLEGLEDDNPDIRLQAALFLSNLNRNEGLPVFFQIVEKERDIDLRDTAIKHILKLGSKADKERLDALIKKPRAEAGVKPKMIRIIIRQLDPSSNDTEVKLNLPISLYNIAIKSFNDEQLNAIEEQAGIDLKKLQFNLEDLQSGHVLFEVVTGQEEIKMFLE